MTDTTTDYIRKVCDAAPFADNDAGIPQMVALIEALAAERDVLVLRVAELETAKWEVQHTDTMNDMVSLGMERDALQAKLNGRNINGNPLPAEPFVQACVPKKE